MATHRSGGPLTTNCWPTIDGSARNCGPAHQRIAQLERQVEDLLRLIEKLRGEGKRQAAPFRKQDQPMAEPKKPGRKSGTRHGPHAASY